MATDRVPRPWSTAGAAPGRWLWAGALLGFVVGDTATTLAGLAHPGVAEAGPVARALVPLKLATAGAAYLCWRLVPRPHAHGVPLGLTVVGLAAIAWNLAVLAGA